MVLLLSLQKLDFHPNVEKKVNYFQKVKKKRKNRQKRMQIDVCIHLLLLCIYKEMVNRDKWLLMLIFQPGAIKSPQKKSVPKDDVIKRVPVEP